MKDLSFYDHRHGYMYTVKNPKNRKSAKKIIFNNVVGKIWDGSTTQEVLDDNVIEVEKTFVFHTHQRAK